ncbi:MAG: hypothetical protein IT442_01130 [Phycisphaeraceae bacterium]|nr:hypothetical protein [Phycisphaeraceae bacterium]
MKPYAAILNARFRILLQYRAAALAGLFCQVIFGLIAIMGYEAFYASSERQPPMSFGQLVGYVWLGQAMLGMLPWNADGEIRGVIRSGAVAYELLRPVDLYGLWFSRAVALRVAPTLLRAVPMFLLAMFGLPLLGLGEWALAAPPSWAAAGAWAAAMGAALLLSCAVTMLVNISLIPSVGSDGVSILLTAAVTFFSGMVIPLPLFPDWLRPLLQANPLAGLVDTPFRLYTGHHPPSAAVPLVARQLFWTLALVLLGRWLLARSTRNLVIQGG